MAAAPRSEIRLASEPDDSYDIIYFDPMFSEAIDNSNAIRTIHHQTEQSGLNVETIIEARRVARRRVRGLGFLAPAAVASNSVLSCCSDRVDTEKSFRPTSGSN